MTVALLVPVLGRPARVEPLLQNIAAVTPEQHRVIFAASDQPTISELDRLGAEYLKDQGDTWPNRINRLFHATTEPYVFLGADDLLYHPDWLKAAMYTMGRVDGVVMVNDLHNPNGTHAFVSRRYIVEDSGCVDIPNVVVCPLYGHCFSDNELIETARSRGRWGYCVPSVVEHLHPAAGKAPTDDTYAKGMSTLDADHRTYLSRRRMWLR